MTPFDYRQFSKAMAKLCRILAYLMETRNTRRKGCKLATEAVVWDAIERLLP